MNNTKLSSFACATLSNARPRIPRAKSRAAALTRASFASPEWFPLRYMRALQDSEFCLTSPGMGFGVRIVDYVAAACIPVVIRPGQLLMPHEPDLDYDGFAVSVPFSEIASLPALLGGLSEAAIRAKRERLRQVHKMFLWDEKYGTAYETVRDALARQLAATV